MSITRTNTLTCPHCEQSITGFDVVFAVNVESCPEHREGILDGSFQTATCGSCEKTIRLDPEFSYMDFQRGQFISVRPAIELQKWPEIEAEVKRTYKIAYGIEASPEARKIGEKLAVRAVFGWPALREKIVLHELEIDDIDLELVKALVLRSEKNMPLTDDVELRLIEANEETLNMAWLDSSKESHVIHLEVPRELLNQVKSDSFQSLRDEFNDVAYIDINRLLVIGES